MLELRPHPRACCPATVGGSAAAASSPPPSSSSSVVPCSVGRRVAAPWLERQLGGGGKRARRGGGGRRSRPGRGCPGRRRGQETAVETRSSGSAVGQEAATGRQRRPGDYRCGARLDRQRAATALINESSSSVQKKKSSSNSSFIQLVKCACLLFLVTKTSLVVYFQSSTEQAY